jgi:hypothetical protein
MIFAALSLKKGMGRRLGRSLSRAGEFGHHLRKDVVEVEADDVLSLLDTAKAAVSNDAALRGVDRRALHVVKLSLLERARDERLGKEGERPAQQDDSDLREKMLQKFQGRTRR